MLPFPRIVRSLIQIAVAAALPFSWLSPYMLSSFSAMLVSTYLKTYTMLETSSAEYICIRNNGVITIRKSARVVQWRLHHGHMPASNQALVCDYSVTRHSDMSRFFEQLERACHYQLRARRAPAKATCLLCAPFAHKAQATSPETAPRGSPSTNFKSTLRTLRILKVRNSYL